MTGTAHLNSGRLLLHHTGSMASDGTLLIQLHVTAVIMFFSCRCAFDGVRAPFGTVWDAYATLLRELITWLDTDGC